jgi:hypothetical protein
MRSRGKRLFGLCAVVFLLASCSAYRSVSLGDPTRVELARGDEVRVLTNDGERFRATVASFDAGVLQVGNKEYGYQDGTSQVGQRERARYEMSDLESIQVLAEGARPLALSRRTRMIVAATMLVLNLLVPPQVLE